MNQRTAALVVLLILFAISLAKIDSSFPRNNYRGYTFKQFVKDFNKSYPENTTNFRKLVFLNNLKNVQEHNIKIKNKTEDSYLKGINEYSDLTNKEYHQLFLKNRQMPPRDHEMYTQLPKSIVVPKEINWVRAGKVTSIKNQKSCGGCYAFSTIAAIESAYLIAESIALDLSEQQILDCIQDNNGCKGGNAEVVYQYVKDFGVTLEENYKFLDQDTRECNKNVTTLFNITSYGVIKQGDCDELARALTLGPVTVEIIYNNLIDYKSGILKECPGKAENVNHGVLLVGMTDQYWLIKNSKGDEYGEDGFIRIARGNTCQICAFGTYPIIQK